MAGIDKTYLNTYEEYLEVLDWCNKTGTVTDKYGNTFNFKDFMYNPCLSKEDFKPNMILWNTPIYADMYLIRYCPIDVIQHRLHEQYPATYYNDILDEVSEYDTFQRNGLGKHLRVKVLKRPHKIISLYWLIEIEDEDWRYNEYTNEWVNFYENKEYTTNICSLYAGKLTIRKIMRILRKWNLPKGLTITIRGMYANQDWILVTKE